MRKILMFLPLLLAGCAPYTPDPLIILDKDKYVAAVTACTEATKNWKPPGLSGSDIASGAIEGGSDTISYFPINPAIPALGIAGSAGNAAAKDIDVTGHARKNVNRHCVEDKTLMDRSAIMAKTGD
jgi:hypothetical protein